MRKLHPKVAAYLAANKAELAKTTAPLDMVKTCSICHDDYIGWGNNAYPVNDGRCCDECKDNVVIPARIANLAGRR